jgi:predicted permease
MGGWWRDLQLAVRGLVRRPGFTAVAVLTVALGIGANTAVFTLVDGVLLRPLPLPDAHELVSLQHLGRDGQDELPQSGGLHFLYMEQARTLASLAMFSPTSANLVRDGDPERLIGQAATPGFFPTLGVDAARGRTFSEAEGQQGGPSVVVLSDGLWRSSFGAAPDVIGTTIDLDGVTREVVGVMPPDFGYPDRNARFWIPLQLDEAQAPIAQFFGQGVARMADGETLETVQAELTGLLARLPELRPGDPAVEFLMGVEIRARTRSLKESLVGDVSRTLWILLGTVAFVLLIACANVANLLLVRAEGRQRELALRVAVGAGRWQVMRGFIAESVVLAGAGAAAGLAIAFLAIRVTAAFIPSDLPRMDEVGLDLRVLGFTVLSAGVAAIVFSLFPLARYGVRDLAGQLRDGGGARGATGGRDRHRLRNGLVVTQVALALVLLVGSGLMMRSFIALGAIDPGFEAEGVVTARVIVPPGEIEGWQETDAFFEAVRRRIAQQPGVLSAGWGSSVPLGGNGVSFGGIEVEDHPRSAEELPIFAALPQVDEGWVEALGIELLAGRTFQRGDGADGTRSAMVSRAFAEEWWPDESPLGRGVRYGGEDEEWYRIVGVVDDVRHYGLARPPDAMIYFPVVTSQGETTQVTRSRDIAIRVQGDPLAFVPILRRELRAVNPRIPLANPRTMAEVFRASTARTSFTMAMLGAASGIALLLGLIGIYGVISYVVSQRTREIGIRMALGATAPSVRTLVVRQGLGLALGGVALGLLAAAGMSRVMESVLFGVSAIDPLTYGGVAGALVAVAMLASWLPALRAASVDPSLALRSD